MKRWDVILIGSGISSLTSAALLSKKGKSVCVLEQHTKPGGYLHCFNRFGVQFDTGGHYVGAMDPGQPFHTLLNYLGVWDDNLFTPLDTNGFDVFQFPSFKVEVPKGYEEFKSRLCSLFPQERDGIVKYLDLVKETVKLFPTYSFDATIEEIALMKALESSVKQVVDGMITDEKLKSVLYTYSALYGVMPEHMSFGLHCLVLDSFIIGSYGFKNGGDALAHKFVEMIRKQGGEVRLKTRVQKLVTKEKQVTQVVLETGETLEAEWVISGIHPKATFRFFESTEHKPAFMSRLNKMEESCALFGLYGYGTTEPDLAPGKNYYYFASEKYQEFLGYDKPTDLPGAVFLARNDREGAHSQKYPVTLNSAFPFSWVEQWKGSKVNRRDSSYYELKDTVAKSVLKSVDRYVPHFSSWIKEYDASTPLTNLYFNGSENGTAYGIYHSIQNTGIRALGPRTHFSNLLLTGQNTLCPGFLGAAISGLRSAGHLIGMKPILKELSQWGQT